MEVGKTMRVVTIDGPAGAGKSTVARRLADRLGWRLLDTGAMYRAVTLAALRAGVDLESDRGPRRPGRPGRRSGSRPAGSSSTARTSRRSSGASRSPGRRATWPTARASARGSSPGSATSRPSTDVVAEGRDQGTIVFPDAFRKFFLTASPEERARRRHAEFAGTRRVGRPRRSSSATSASATRATRRGPSPR